MRMQAEQRLAALRTDFTAGQQMLADMEVRQAELRGTLMRISGAIQVLEELLSKVAEQPAGAPLGDAASPALPAVAASAPNGAVR